MLRIIRDLFRYNLEFALGSILTGIVVGLAALSIFSPYPARYFPPADGRPAIVELPIRHDVARPGHILDANLRDAKYSSLRLLRRDLEPHSVSPHRTRLRLRRRLHGSGSHVDQ